MLGVRIFGGKGLMINISGYFGGPSRVQVSSEIDLSQVWSSMVRSLVYLDSIHHYLKKARHFKVNYWGLYWIAYQLQFFLLQVEAGSSLQTFFYIWNIASHQIFQIINSMILLWRLLTDCQYFSYWIRRWAISCQMYAILS